MSSPEIELDRGDNEETGRNTYSLGSSSMNHREAPGMILEWTDKDSTVKSKHSVNLFSMSKVHWNVSDSNGLEMVQHMTSEAASMTAPSRVLKYRKTQEELGPDPTERSQQRNRITEGSYQRQAIQRTTKKEDQFLWDASDFNELEMIQHLFNPFLSTFMDDGKYKTQTNTDESTKMVNRDKLFLPSQKRKEDAMAEGRGRRPDFFMYCEKPGEQCHVFAMEAKKSGQGTVLQNDLEKVGLLMKDAIDTMCKQRINVSEVKVFGLVIVGAEGVVYSMELPARGIYFMKRYAIIYAPRSQHDLHVLAGTINVFMNLREELARTIRVCKGPTLKNPLNLIRPSFGTPIKVTRTGVKSDFDTSPSLRPRPSSHPQ
ncbi:hypothetical protein BGX31_007701 [Mortierella sp. GBA43]|nr:hypothetical protein BGX31_007701 [Mortierella sp. GBA43]